MKYSIIVNGDIMQFDNIKDLRTDAGMTQEVLSSKLNIAQNTYSQYERGESEWTASYLLKLHEIFDVSVDYLLGVKDRSYIDKGKLDDVTKELIENIMMLSDEEKQKVLKFIAYMKNNTK